MFGIGRNIVGITSWGKWAVGSSPVSDSVTKLAGRAGMGLLTMGGGNSSESGSRESSV